MAEKWKAALKKGGPAAVGMFGSGQWTIWEGYAAAKLFKAGFRTNNLDPNARHCMASAVAGFMRTFGIDEPMGCYDDFEAADAFVLWGSNMAEMHPILWSRITDRRLSMTARQGGGALDIRAPLVRAGRHPAWCSSRRRISSSSMPSPTTSSRPERVNKEFVDKHAVFKLGQTDIGYGLRPDASSAEKATGKNAATPAGMKPITFEQFAKVRSNPTRCESSREAVGRAGREASKRMAELYADPKTEGYEPVGRWDSTSTPAARGSNNLVYNVHLLIGKISEPGNSPFSLTGQPSACGTAREVGTFSHRLPADMVVTNQSTAPRRKRSGSCPRVRSPTRSACMRWRRTAR